MSYLDRWVPHVETLRRLWAEGKSAAQMVAIINHDAGEKLFTRNAVIGKLHRLGLKSQTCLPRAPYAPRAPKEAAPRIAAVKPTFAPPPAPRRAPGPATFKLCQWPMNEWAWGDAHLAQFCHEPTQSGSSYCCAHHAKAWVKPIKAGNIPTIDWTVKRRAA